MVAHSEEKILDGVMRYSNFTRQLSYNAETTGANGWPDGRYRIGLGEF